MLPPKPITIRDPEFGHLAGMYKKGISQEREFPRIRPWGMKGSGTMIPQENKMKFLGNGEFPKKGVCHRPWYWGDRHPTRMARLAKCKIAGVSDNRPPASSNLKASQSVMAERSTYVDITYYREFLTYRISTTSSIEGILRVTRIL